MCNYRCNNAGVLSAHVKVHQNVLGIIHALADPSRSDEEQLRQLAGVAGFKTGGEASALVGKEAEESCSSLSSSGSAAPQPKLDLLLGRAGEDAKGGGGKKVALLRSLPGRLPGRDGAPDSHTHNAFTESNWPSAVTSALTRPAKRTTCWPIGWSTVANIKKEPRYLICFSFSF